MSEKETEKKGDAAPKLLGRLVLATGTIVEVPAEAVSASTQHYDPKNKITVPVSSAFVLPAE